MNPTIGIGLLTAGGILVFAGWKDKNILDLVGGFNPNSSAPAGGSGPGGHWNVGALDFTDASNPGGGGDFSTGDMFPAFSQQTLGRTDMGVDFTSKGAIPALGNGVVTRVAPQNSGTGWPGAGDGGRGNRGAMIVYRLTSGPAKGKYVYVAENVDPAKGLHVGQRIAAGQTVAVARGAFPYLETGWASNAHGTPLGAPGYVEGKATAAGQSFLRFLGLGN